MTNERRRIETKENLCCVVHLFIISLVLFVLSLATIIFIAVDEQWDRSTRNLNYVASSLLLIHSIFGLAGTWFIGTDCGAYALGCFWINSILLPVFAIIFAIQDFKFIDQEGSLESVKKQYSHIISAAEKAGKCCGCSIPNSPNHVNASLCAAESAGKDCCQLVLYNFKYHHHTVMGLLFVGGTFGILGFLAVLIIRHHQAAEEERQHLAAPVVSVSHKSSTAPGTSASTVFASLPWRIPGSPTAAVVTPIYAKSASTTSTSLGTKF